MSRQEDGRAQNPQLENLGVDGREGPSENVVINSKRCTLTGANIKQNILKYVFKCNFYCRCTDVIPNYETANRKGAMAWGEFIKSKIEANN